VKIVLCWSFGYAISSNLTFFAYTHGRLFTGTGDASPSIIGVGRQSGCLPKICSTCICKHVEQVILCLRLLLGELTQPFTNPLARFKWAARWKGQGNVKRENRKERKGKGGIGKGGVASAPRKKLLRVRHPRFNLLLNWFINGKLLI